MIQLILAWDPDVTHNITCPTKFPHRLLNKKQIDAGLELTQGVEKIVDDTIEKYFDGSFIPEPEPVVEPKEDDVWKTY